ncbi:MAG TPA: hypothetical protein VFH47_08555 [Candidatus Thermoplasmatota archaeon]|nr:hypothetical protein [Candidatus Thermoplasmatota archaeon]
MAWSDHWVDPSTREEARREADRLYHSGTLWCLVPIVLLLILASVLRVLDAISPERLGADGVGHLSAVVLLLFFFGVQRILEAYRLRAVHDRLPA